MNAKTINHLTEDETISYIKRHTKEACRFYPHTRVMAENKVCSIIRRGFLVGSLKERYSDLCNLYVEEFIKKHELTTDDDWVGNEVGGIVTIGDCFINFDDIRLDIDKNAPKHCFFKWYYETLDYINEKGTTEGCVNYKSYLMGYGKENKK